MSKNPSEDQKVQDLIAMLDQLMSQGGGHVNVQVDDPDAPVSIETMKSTDCASGNMACKIPTLHKGIDDDKTEREE